MNIVVREYLGSSIEFKMIDGVVYANATSMCKAFNKVPKDWLRTEQTKRYISALEQKADMPNELIIVSKGGNVEESGTWIYEKLVLKLAQWLDVNFELWMDEQIATLLREGSVSLKTPSYQIVDPIERAKKWIEEEEERRRLAIENGQKEKVIIKQKNTIHDLTSDIDTIVLRKTFTDYINKVVRSTSSGYAEVYNK